MKVLLYSGANFSDNTLPLYKAMKDIGVDVTLIWELRNPNSSLFDDGQIIDVHGLIKATEFTALKKYERYVDMNNVYVMNLPYYNPLSFKYLKHVLSLIRFIKDNHFDIIHTDMFYLGWQALVHCFRKKSVLVIHEAIPHARKLKLYQKLFRELSIKLTTKRVILNKSCEEEFIRRNKIKKETLLVNRLGPLDCISVYSRENIQDFDKNKLLFWGRIAEYKGIEYLCEAMLEVHEMLPNARLTIAGGGSFYFDITPYTGLSYINFNNHYLSMQEMYDELTSSAFTVCPYTNSSQSGGILTSLALNIPVIASDFPTIREMIDSELTGLLFKPKDSKSLADAIIRLLSDDALQHNLRCNIREKYTKGDYSWKGIASRYIDFYRK